MPSTDEFEFEDIDIDAVISFFWSIRNKYRHLGKVRGIEGELIQVGSHHLFLLLVPLPDWFAENLEEMQEAAAEAPSRSAFRSAFADRINQLRQAAASPAPVETDV